MDNLLSELLGVTQFKAVNTQMTRGVSGEVAAGHYHWRATSPGHPVNEKKTPPSQDKNSSKPVNLMGFIHSGPFTNRYDKVRRSVISSLLHLFYSETCKVML